MVNFTDREKHALIEQELTSMKRSYPRKVEKGVITEQFAGRQIAIMTEVMNEYRLKIRGSR